MMVELAENILVHAPVPSNSHAALRSGFAGYPANPRWSATKFRAWKTGRQLREALVRGDMVVRPTDLRLIPTPTTQQEEEILATETEQENKFKDSPNSRNFRFPVWAKRVLTSYQTG